MVILFYFFVLHDSSYAVQIPTVSAFNPFHRINRLKGFQTLHMLFRLLLDDFVII